MAVKKARPIHTPTLLWRGGHTEIVWAIGYVGGRCTLWAEAFSVPDRMDGNSVGVRLMPIGEKYASSAEAEFAAVGFAESFLRELSRGRIGPVRDVHFREYAAVGDTGKPILIAAPVSDMHQALLIAFCLEIGCSEFFFEDGK